MTRYDINEDIAYVSYKIEGWMRYASIMMLGLFISGTIIYFPEPVMLITCSVGIALFSAILTYKVETILNIKTKKAYHRVTVFGVCRKNELHLSQLHMSARLHSTQYVTYPILWLINEHDKKYKIGEFFGQEVDAVAKKLSSFSGLDYEKSF